MVSKELIKKTLQEIAVFLGVKITDVSVSGKDGIVFYTTCRIDNSDLLHMPKLHVDSNAKYTLVNYISSYLYAFWRP